MGKLISVEGDLSYLDITNGQTRKGHGTVEVSQSQGDYRLIGRVGWSIVGGLFRSAQTGGMHDFEIHEVARDGSVVVIGYSVSGSGVLRRQLAVRTKRAGELQAALVKLSEEMQRFQEQQRTEDAKTAKQEVGFYRRLDEHETGRPLTEDEQTAASELLGELVLQAAEDGAWDDDEYLSMNTSTYCALLDCWEEPLGCRMKWAHYTANDMRFPGVWTEGMFGDEVTLCARCVRMLVERGELPDGMEHRQG
jgi:hypothetical protein